MAKSPSTLIQFRVGEDWVSHLDTTLREIGAFEPGTTDPIDRSSFIRDAVGIEVAFWKRSPYVCPKARHFVFVTKEGEFWCHREEFLKLNNTVAKIPVALSMKMAKRKYFRDKYGNNDEEIRRVWLLNNATLWRRTRPNLSVLDTYADENGVFEKYAILRCGLPIGSNIIRESCYGLADYAQTMSLTESGRHRLEDLRHGDPSEDQFDHVDIPVDIPTRDLELIVVVDEGLFGEPGALGEDFDRSLHFELRNRDEIAFSSTHAFEALLRERFLERIGASFPRDGYKDQYYIETTEKIGSAFERFRNRAAQLAEANRNLCKDTELARERIRRLELPERYLFYRLNWSWVHVGIHLSVKWVKPERG